MAKTTTSPKSYLTGFDQHGIYGFLSYIPWIASHYIQAAPPTQNSQFHLSGQYSCQFNESTLGMSYLDTIELPVPANSSKVVVSFAFVIMASVSSHVLDIEIYENGVLNKTYPITGSNLESINGWYNVNRTHTLSSSSVTTVQVIIKLKPQGHLSGILAMDNLAINFMESAPELIEKTLLYTDIAGKVTGIDRYTGTKQWDYQSQYGNLDSSIYINNDLAYYGDGNTQANVYCLDTSTGGLKWKTPIPGSVDTSPVLSQGLLLVASSNGSLYALFIETGIIAWNISFGTRASGDLVYGMVAVDTVLYLATENGIYATDVVAKQSLWHYPSASVPFAPVVSKDFLLLAAQDGTMACLNRTTGTKVWSLNVGAPINSQLYRVGGIIIIGTDDGRLLGYLVSDGTKKWERSYPGTMIRSFTVDGPYIYVAANQINGTCYCLSYYIDANGDWSFVERWNNDLPNGAQCPPSIEGDMVFWSASNSQLYAMSKISGTTDWQFSSGNQGFASPTPIYQKPSIPLNRRYDQCSFIVAHNAYANYDDGWWYAQQTNSIVKQLDMGARGLELDIFTKSINGTNQIVYDHGGLDDWRLFYYSNWKLLSDSLTEIRAWLERNKNEILTIIFEQPQIPNSSTALTKAFTDSGINSFVFYANKTNTGSSGSTWNVSSQGWPTLQWMVDNGKRLVVFSEKRPTTTSGFPYLWDYSVENQFGGESLLSGCEPRGQSSDLSNNTGKLITMNYAFNIPNAPPRVKMPSTYTLTNNYYWLMAKVRCCQQASGNNRLPNLIKVNFFEYGAFGGPLAVVQDLNNEFQ